MLCKTCGSSQFFVQDGISYCIECSTQVEETQVEETDNVSFSNRSLVSSSPVRRHSKEKRQIYSSWITAEAFNVIIYQQVCALIKLGASPKLKPTVLHIWSKYLQMCEVAFRKDGKSDEGIPRLGLVPAKRDLKVLYGDKTVLTRKRKNLKEQLPEKEIGAASTSEEELEKSSETDSRSATDSSSATDSMPSKPKYSTHAKKILQSKRSTVLKNRCLYWKSVSNMNLPKTLSFCHLGLLYTNDRLSLSDLLRFAYEETIPYINLLDKISPLFNLQHSDSSQFLTYVVPDMHSVYKASSDIAKFLNLPEFKEPSIFLAVSCYIKELNLPDDIKPMVRILYDQYIEQVCDFPSINQKEISHDCLAVAFIIIVLKMLFVLDDNFEIEHSKVMVKLNAIRPENKFFVWADWKEQALLKEYLFLTENPGYGEISKLDSLCTDSMLSKCSFTHLKPPSSEDFLNHRSGIVKKNEIKNMLSRIVNIPSCNKRISTSFPISYKINEFVKEWRTWHMFKETKDIDFTLLKKDFSTYSLAYNPSLYNIEEDELIYLLITSLYIPETSDNTHLYFFQQCFSKYDIVRTSSKYWFLNSAQNPNTSDASSDWINEVPASFKWLITYVCKHLCFKCIPLYKEIIKIEKVLFLNRKLIRHKLPKSCNRITVNLK